MGTWIISEAAPAVGGSGPSASTVFYLTLLFIFLAAIITTVFTKWSRDKCLKYFHDYPVTLERSRGQTSWGELRVFSTGLEIRFQHEMHDARGQRKTSYLMYQQEVESQLLSVFRYTELLSDSEKSNRRRQIHQTFNPGPLRRAWRGVRNLVNTLRDAFAAALGVVVGQYQRTSPAGAVLASQGAQVTNIGQTLLGRFANAYEPLLEQYIGQPVILDVTDPLNPNNELVQYSGYLADYTQQFVALFNVEHDAEPEMELTLPDVSEGEDLAPLPPPPAPGAPPPVLAPPLLSEHGLAVRIDGRRFKILNTRPHPIAVRRLTREGFEPLNLGMVLPAKGTLSFTASDARGGRLAIQPIHCLDVVAPRKFAIVRHAGKLVARRGLVDELNLDHLPLVPKFLGSERRPGN